MVDDSPIRLLLVDDQRLLRDGMRLLLEWMTHDQAEWDMRQCHIQRFQPHQTTVSFTAVVTKKNYRDVYDIIHPA